MIVKKTILILFFIFFNLSNAQSNEIVTVTCNYLGDNFDTALLNGTLMEAIRFMKGEADMVAMYEKRYLQAIGLLQRTTDGKLRQDYYRSGQFKTNVG